MHKWLLVVLCGLCLANAFAQTQDSLPTAGFYLKLNPLAIAELDGGTGVSIEYISATAKLGLQLEVQPIYFSFDSFNGDGGFESPERTIKSGMPTGIEIRPEVRYYLKTKSKGIPKIIKTVMADVIPFRRRRSPLFVYTSVDFLYKHTTRERLGELNISNGDVGTGYNQKGTYTDIKKVMGFDIKAGALSPIGKSARWMIDTFIGLGYRYKTYSYKNLPAGASQPGRILFIGSTENNQGVKENLGLKVHGISLPAGLKLTYRL